MNLNKLFMYILCLFTLINIVSAFTISSNDVSYWTMDNTTVDSTPNGNNLTGGTPTFTPVGVINGAYAFSTASDFFATTIDETSFSSNVISTSFWFETDDATGTSTQYVYASSGGGSADSPFFRITTDGRISGAIRGTSAQVFTSDILDGVIDDNRFYFIVMAYDGIILRWYVDGVLEKTTSGVAGAFGNFPTIPLGYNAQATTQDLVGTIDEFAWFDFNLSQDNVTDLYNSGLGLQYPYTGISTPTLVHNVQAFYNSTSITIQLNSSSNVNISFFLDTDAEVSVCNNCSNATIKLGNQTFINPQRTSPGGTFTIGFADFIGSPTETPQLYCTERGFIDFSNFSFITVTTGLISTVVSGGWITADCDGASCTKFTSINCTGYKDLTEGMHNITFKAVDVNGTTNATANFTIDITPPVINNNILSEYNSYTFDFNSSCTDVNLEFCNISLNNQTVLLNSSSFTSTRNGNITFSISARDFANNTNEENGTILVNPLQRFNFQLSNGSQIFNFSFNNISYEFFAEFPLFDVGIGNHSLLFEKIGFATTPINFTFNSTSLFNLTTNITTSKIILRIFNRETLQLLTGLTTITLQADQGFDGNTTTGLLNISDINFVSGAYQILAEHLGFLTETVFFNYDNQEELNIDIFMLNSSSPDAGSITLIVKNSLSQLISQATCSALEWRANESVFTSVAQGQTNVNGETILNIEVGTKIYKFSCTKGSFTTITNAQIIQVDLSSLTIILDDVFLVPSTLFPNFAGTFVNATINSTHQLLTFTFQDSDGLVSEACIKIFRQKGNQETFLSESCLSSSTGVIVSTLNINQSFDIVARAVISSSEIIDFVFSFIIFKNPNSFETLIEKYNLQIILPVAIFMIAVGLGLATKSLLVSLILGSIASFVSFTILPNTINSIVAIFINVILGLTLWGVFSRK